MAAVHPSKPSRSRHRSSSDPFSDPVYHSASIRPSSRSQPPPPPPKSAGYKMSATSAARPHRDNIADAVRDTVTLRSSEANSRQRMGRSQTAIQSSTPGTRPPAVGRRSQSQDSVLQAAAALEKAKGNGKSRSSKKGSMHADVIDRLDFTGVGPMFHHDGPFDACAPSRNRHRTKAPMLAWTNDEGGGQRNTESPYPTPDVYRNNFTNSYDEPKKKVDAIAEAWGIHEPEPYEDFSAGGGSSRIEGDTPASSVYNGREAHSNTSSRNGTPHHKRVKESRDLREVYKEYLDEGQQPPRRTKRSTLPPPQPIFVGDTQVDGVDIAAPAPSPPAGSPGGPKRTKSLMHRIRKMRDAPNVPVGEDGSGSGDGSPPSPSSAENVYPFASQQNSGRPTHRPQNSFLGRFGGGARGNNPRDNVSPTSEGSENYVYVDDVKKEKELPATPGNGGYASPAEAATGGYFDDNVILSTSPNGAGMARRTSLLKKVRGVVRGNK